jgi:hypothetical protein
MTDGVMTDGGREIPNQLSPTEHYIPMATDEWHTIRVDLNGDGTFDVWLDNGGSDWQHASGTTAPTSDTFIAFGVTDRSFEQHEFSTACVAWGEGAGEIPAAPSGAEEICDNDDIDDNGNGQADCGDPACDCSHLPAADVCNMFVEVIDTFDDDFVPDPVTGVYSVKPPAWTRSDDGDPNDPAVYTKPMYTDAENETYELGGNALRWRILYDAKSGEQGDDIDTICGTDPDICYWGRATLEQSVNVEDLVPLPVDWTKPLLVALDVHGSDWSTGVPEQNEWDPFIEFDGSIPARGQVTNGATTASWIKSSTTACSATSRPRTKSTPARPTPPGRVFLSASISTSGTSTSRRRPTSPSWRTCGSTTIVTPLCPCCRSACPLSRTQPPAATRSTMTSSPWETAAAAR